MLTMCEPFWVYYTSSFWAWAGITFGAMLVAGAVASALRK